MLEKALYLIPVGISDAPPDYVLPAVNKEIISGIRFFIVENVRTARRFLRRLIPDFDIDGTVFFELNGHTDLSRVTEYLAPLRQGEAMGIMSEAGCPAVADPGALPVSIAQREGIRVIPLVGPSSILMALMASGFNGQGFSFNGYLPIEEGARTKKVRELESISAKADMTQIFIETPYRNGRMIQFLARTLRPDTLLCVAVDITDPERESIITRPARKWRDCTECYDKRPAIFLIYAR